MTTSIDFAINEKDISHLSIIAFAYIDKNAFSQSIMPNLDLQNIPNINEMLIGKITYERIIINNKISTEAIYYQDSAGKIWLGDIFVDLDDPNYDISNLNLRDDQIPGIIRKGKNAQQAATFDDNVLTVVKAPNTVIQDFRIRNAIENIPVNFSVPQKLFEIKPIDVKQFAKIKNSEKISYFSDLWSSRDISQNTRFMFAVDIKNMVLHHSQYGAFWENLCPEDRNKVFGGKNLISLKLVRRRVTSETNTDLFSQDEEIEDIAPVNQEFPTANGFLNRIFLDTEEKSGMFHFYSGYDKNISTKTFGSYQYGLKYTFEDSLKKLILSRLNKLSNDTSKLKKFYSESTQPKYYNLISNSYTALYAEEKTQQYNVLIPTMLTNFRVLHKIISGKDIDYEELSSSLLNITHPQTGTPDGLQFLLNTLENFLNFCGDLLDEKSLQSAPGSKTSQYMPSSVKSAKKKHFVSEEYYFHEIYDVRKEDKIGFEVLRKFPKKKVISNGPKVLGITKKYGIPKVTYTAFKKRVDNEMLKYFGNAELKNISVATNPYMIEMDGTITKKTMIDPVIKQNQLLQQDKYSFLTATGFRTKDGTLIKNTHAGEKINFQELNFVMTEILRKQSNDSDSSVKVSQETFTNLTTNDKKLKQSLNQLLADKGCVAYEKVVDPLSSPSTFIEYIPLSENGGQLLEGDEFSDELKAKFLPNAKQNLNELNYNNSLLFIVGANGEENFLQFNKSVKKVYYPVDTVYSDVTDLVSPEELLTLNLPNQYKHLLAWNNPSAIQTGDLQNPAFFDKGPVVDRLLKQDSLEKKFGLWMNYFNVYQVEYLRTFKKAEELGCKEPVWTLLDNATFDDIKTKNQSVLCRITRYTNPDLGINSSELPEVATFDKYFILASENADLLAPFKPVVPVTTISDLIFAKKQLRALDNIKPEYLNSNLNPKQVVQRDMIKKDKEKRLNEGTDSEGSAFTRGNPFYNQ